MLRLKMLLARSEFEKIADRKSQKVLKMVQVETSSASNAMASVDEDVLTRQIAVAVGSAQRLTRPTALWQKDWDPPQRKGCERG